MTTGVVRPSNRVVHPTQPQDRPPGKSTAATHSPLSPRNVLGLLVFALATAAGLYFAAQAHLAWPVPVRKSWPDALAINLAHYWAWGATVPIIAALARYVPLRPGRRLQSLGVHLIAATILAGGEIVLVAIALSWLGIGTESLSLPFLRTKVVANFYSSFPTYWLILFVLLTLDYQTKYRDRELAAERLQRQLAEARLDSLRAQLNPHFLFNALHSVSSLMYDEPAAADRMIRKLGDLLRASLDRGRRPKITLGEELDFVRDYLAIEQLRFGDRLQVRIDAQGEVLDALVPAFTLQPLVENAVHHAIAPRKGGRVEISARLDQGSVRLSVVDDGQGMPERHAEGMGLANLRARLDELYAGAAALHFPVRKDGRTCAEVIVPWHAGQVSSMARPAQAL
jgi:two-component system LytT family sensor kinase